MAVLVRIVYEDVNGEQAENRFWAQDPIWAKNSLYSFNYLSNAKIIEASYSVPLDISDLPNNVAVAENVETVKTKMAVTMSGPPPQPGLFRPTVTLQIPAPLGELVNGLESDTQIVEIQELLNVVLDDRGQPLDRVDRVAYAK